MSIFSLFSGKKLEKQGEITAMGKSHTHNRVDIHKLELEDGTKGIGLNIVTKGFLSYQSLPLSLNQVQARELVSIINQTLDDE